MRAAEQLAIRYALERFEDGDLKVNAVHELLEEMSQQMADLRNILRLQEDKLTHAGLLVESHADILDRKFWAELPESSKKKALLSEDRSEEHTSELQSRFDLVCRLLLEKKKKT